MTALSVAVIGHVDHGKTALVRALTGKDTDRLEEERQRGMSIVAGYARLRRGDCDLDLIDLPGHERFMRAMISGAGGVAAVLLCVAANEGVKPQTLEHLDVARLLGIRRAIIAVTKADLADDELRARRLEEMERLALRYGFSGASAVATSCATLEGLDGLADRLAAVARDAPPARDDGFIYMPVDRAFATPGFGPVVTGTLRRGVARVGDVVAVHPSGREFRIRSLHIHGEPIAQASPGRRVAMALRGADLQQLGRGMAVATPGALRDSAWFDVEITAADGAEALRDGQSLRLLSGTLEADCRLRLLDRGEVAAGDRAIAQVRLTKAIALPAREAFVLRRHSPIMTWGGGRVLDPLARRRRRGPPPASLVAQSEGRSTEAILHRLSEAGGAGETIDSLACFAGCDAERIRKASGRIDPSQGGSEKLFHPDVWRAMKRALHDAVARSHVEHPLSAGARPDVVAASLGIDGETVRSLAADLARHDELVLDRGILRCRGFLPGAQGSASLALDIAETLKTGGLSPADESAIVGDAPARIEALRFLLDQGIVVRARDRVQRRSILFHRDALRLARDTLRQAFPPGVGFLARDAGAALGISRKFSIPLLEYFDNTHMTVRKGDLREMTRDDVMQNGFGGDRGLVAPLVFKTSGSPIANGGFDSHPPPPNHERGRQKGGDGAR